MTRTVTYLALLAALTTATAANARLRVVTTTTDLGWITRTIGADRVDVHVLTRGYQDPHELEPKPSFIVKLARADALFHVGLELESAWLPRLLDGAHNPDIQPGRSGLFSPVDSVEILERPSGALDRAEGDVHPFGNPHYWLSPTNAAAIAVAIGQRLAELDPDDGDGHRERAHSLARAIAERDRDWQARLAPHRGLKLVTYHRTYSYFLAHYGLVAVDYIEPKPGVPPSSRHLSRLIATIRDQQVRLLLIENFFEPRNGEFVADKTGVPMVIAPVSVGGEDGIETWFDLIEALVRAVEHVAEPDR